MRKLKKTIHQVIAEEVPVGSRVLDLGCGDGVLLNYLINEKKVKGHGVDINSTAITKSIEKGIPVIQLDLNDLPLDFPDQSFDVVILNQTVQEVFHPDKIITEMLRIGKVAILGCPNFGTMSIRRKFLFTGRMPVTKELPYKWYNTPNIHLSTLKDFIEYCQESNINILKVVYLKRKRKNKNYKRINFLPNLRAEIGIFKVYKN